MIPTASDQPRWASPPGDTIIALLHERGLTLEDLADRARLSDPDARRLLTGELPISARVGQVLHEAIGGSPEFWVRRFAQYAESTHWIQADQLAQALPAKDLVRFGWITSQSDWVAAAQEALDYFDTPNAEQWKQEWNRKVGAAKYRVSPAFEPDGVAVAAWLRQVQLQAEQIAIAEWNPAAFRDTLGHARSLTKQADPQRFLPLLQQLAASGGVAVIVEPPPAGCSLSGAALRDSAGRRVIGLTARHLSDDHFWFTFFHEAGHILDEVDDALVLDRLDEDPTSNAEQAADDFAREVILGGVDPRALSHRDYREIAAEAARLGIGAGLLVGQLQHADLVPKSHFNRLRRRFRWDGTTLRRRA